MERGVPEKILYLYPSISTFIKKDIEILSRHFKVKTMGINGQKLLLPFQLLRQFIFLSLNIAGTRTLICRFAGYHTFLPVIFARVFKKRVLIILGGTECHKFPSINYGAQTKRLYRNVINFSIRNATMLLPVHASLIESAYDYDETGMPAQGCRVFCKNLKTPYKTIYNGYDAGKFYYTGALRKANSFITVAANFNGAEYYRKGIDLIIDTAPLLPECDFLIIGDRSQTISNLPVNVRILPAVPNEQLKEFFSRHEFYLQLSLAEGFPNALCEAMLCGCIPIGSNTFGIPTIIGNTGFILPKKSKEMLAGLIRTAQMCDKTNLSAKAASKIKTEFPIQLREKKLMDAIAQ